MPAPACRAICIAPALVRRFWPHVAPLIEAAMRRGGITDVAVVEAALVEGRALLWLACDERRIRAAAVTELGSVAGMRFCTIVACGGASACSGEVGTGSPKRTCAEKERKSMSRLLRNGTCSDRVEWLPLIAELEHYARREGCQAMRILGRRGWSRLLPEYRCTRVLLEKPLNEEV